MATFLLECRDPKDGRSYDIEYETDGNRFRYEGRAIDICVPKWLDFILPSRKLRPSTPRSPARIKMILGLKCNYHCKYCSQKELAKFEGVSVDEVVNFIKKMPSMFDAPPEEIELWGGEPLVYWKHLQKAVPLLKDLFPEARLFMITNGSLLTDEIVDFIQKYRIRVVISHDGAGQHNRGDDPLDAPEKRRVWARLADNCEESQFTASGLIFAPVLTGNNCNPLAIAKYFETKFPGIKFMLSLDVVSDIGPGTASQSEGIDFTDAQLEAMSQAFLSNEMLSRNNIASIKKDTAAFLKAFANGRTLGELNSKCGISDCVRVFDVKGRLFACQNNTQISYGRIERLGQNQVPGILKANDRSACRTCPFIFACQGACPLSSGNSFARSCRNYFAYFKAIFAIAFKQMSGLEVVRIRGRMLRPEIEMVPTPNGKFKTITEINIPWSDA